MLGIDSVECPLDVRTRIWHKLAGPWKPKHLDALVSEEMGLDQLGEAVQRILAGETIGRVLVNPWRNVDAQ